MSFRSEDLVDDIMRKAPHKIRVFLAFRSRDIPCRALRLRAGVTGCGICTGACGFPGEGALPP